MIRGILIGLDGSDDGAGALELGLRWARRHDALLVGLGIVDEPGIHGSEEVLVGQAYFRKLNTTLVEEMQQGVHRTLGRFAIRCAEAGVACKELEGVGSPVDQIRVEAQRYDLILLGRQTHFQFGWEAARDVTLEAILAGAPRPVVSVPRALSGGDSVLIAYDGSLQAARTLYAFEASGLGQDRDIHVVSAARAKVEAAVLAERAVDFLGLHGRHATPHPIASKSPAEAILEQAVKHDAGLLVMGAYGQPALREFFLGSVTRTLLKQCPIPLFLAH